MKKLIFLTLIFVFTMSSIGMCAVPDPNAGMGDIQFGYTYYNLKKTTGGIDQGKTGYNEIYGNVGLGFGYSAYISHFQSSGTSYTDLGLNTTPLLPNIALMVGQRQMESDNSDSTNKLFCGASFKQYLAGGVAAYATYQKGMHFKDEVIG
ncbi:MAG: hypothetical protein H6Q72_2381, partial [Firmicutes bacterium]|nr:hypothetical protein [Bacillota bacterium]